MDYKTLKTIL